MVIYYQGCAATIQSSANTKDSLEQGEKLRRVHITTKERVKKGGNARKDHISSKGAQIKDRNLWWRARRELSLVHITTKEREK